jgi:hypothetical protein
MGTHASLLASRGLYYELHTKAAGLDRTGVPAARAVAAS